MLTAICTICLPVSCGMAAAGHLGWEFNCLCRSRILQVELLQHRGWYPEITAPWSVEPVSLHIFWMMKLRVFDPCHMSSFRWWVVN